MNWLKRILGYEEQPKSAEDIGPQTERVGGNGGHTARHRSLHGMKDTHSSRLDLASTLIDRTPQFSAVEDRLVQLRSTPPCRPLLVVLQGVYDDLHELFVRRFGEVYLRDAAENWSFQHEFDWSAGAGDAGRLMTDLGHRLFGQRLPSDDV